MKKFFVYLVLIYSNTAIYSQSFNLDSIFEPKLSGESYQIKHGTIGRQFYNENWIVGDLKLTNGEFVRNKLLKYNMLLDEIFWLHDGDYRLIKLEKNFIDEFSFKNYNGNPAFFKKMRVKLHPMMDSTDIFVQVLFEKNITLSVFRKVVAEDHIITVDDGVPYSYDKLVSKPVYYLKLPGMKTVTLSKIRRHNLLRELPDNYKNTMKEFIRVNHLSLRNEKDLIKLVTLLN